MEQVVMNKQVWAGGSRFPSFIPQSNGKDAHTGPWRGILFSHGLLQPTADGAEPHVDSQLPQPWLKPAVVSTKPPVRILIPAVVGNRFALSRHTLGYLWVFCRAGQQPICSVFSLTQRNPVLPLSTGAPHFLGDAVSPKPSRRPTGLESGPCLVIPSALLPD